MKTPRPRWNRGALLSSLPSQFTPVWNGHSCKYPSPYSLSSSWGVEVLRLDEEAMQHQQLTIKQLRVCLPDGTWVDSSDTTAFSCAIDLDKQLGKELQQVDVLLALPATEFQLYGAQYHYRAGEPPAIAYQGRKDVQVQSEKNVVASTTIGLRFSIDENRGYKTHRIARLNRNAQGLWEIDPSFIPPLLAFSAAPMLVAQAEKLLSSSRLKRRGLLALRYKQPGPRVQPDIPLFWMLNVLNRYESVLNAVSLTTALHPELVYRELVKLAGPLLPYTQEWSSADIPHYDHDHLEAVFPPLFALLSALLETCLPARAVEIDLMREKDHLWVGKLQQQDVDSVSGFYLLARSSWPSHRLQSHMLTRCCVGTRHAIHRENTLTDNDSPLQPVNRIPAAIPVDWENLCFAVDLEHSAVQDALASGHCAISVPDHCGNLTLELFAVMEE